MNSLLVLCVDITCFKTKKSGAYFLDICNLDMQLIISETKGVANNKE